MMKDDETLPENYLISSEISYKLPRKILESPKLNLSNSPENYYPSPEKVDLIVNTSSQKRPKLLKSANLSIETSEDRMFFTQQNLINKENEFLHKEDEMRKQIIDLEEQLQIAHNYNLTQQEEFAKFEKLVASFLVNFRDENMIVFDKGAIDFF